MKLSFKEYLDSKDKLLQAIQETPVQTIRYDIKKYCRLPIGEKEDKQYVPLKPKQIIIIEWRYDSVFNDPTPVGVRFEMLKEFTEDEQFNTYWSGTRLKKWLSKHAVELE